MTGGLEWGLLGGCLVCGHATGWWLRGADRYHPVHPAPACSDRLADTLAELETVAAAASGLAAGPRRGAWARRGMRAAAGTPAARPTAWHGLSRGSPFHVPGMREGAPWVVVAETNRGQLTCPAGTDEVHARSVLLRWRLLTEKGFGIADGGVYAVGGVLVDPAGDVADAWGDPLVVRSPRWRPITRVSDWTRCARCSDVLWPGCLIAVEGRTCVTCTAADEHDDPRVWPDEPTRPDPVRWPEHLGGGRRRKKSGGTKESGDARVAGRAELTGGLFEPAGEED